MLGLNPNNEPLVPACSSLPNLPTEGAVARKLSLARHHSLFP
jgi:hypothetical protein